MANSIADVQDGEARRDSMEDSKERRSPRLVYPTRIRVIGQDISGQSFYEDTATLVVNREGARIQLTKDPDPREDIFILSLQTDEGGSFRVVGERGEAEGLYKSWAVELVKAPQKMKVAQNIWGIEFPTLEPDDKGAVRVMLECEACHTRERLYLEENQVDTIIEAGGLHRECGICKLPRLWAVVPYVDQA
jgi:hypothetical protein